MSDLIRRETLLEELRSLKVTFTGKPRQEEIIASVLHIVDEQPAVFDEEKMIEIVDKMNR